MWQKFTRKLSASKKLIKPYLLDQTLVAGLGNVMWMRYFGQLKFILNAKQIVFKKLKSICFTMRLSVSYNLGLKKAAQLSGLTKMRLVKMGQCKSIYKSTEKRMKPCPRCATPIEKIKVGGRGTHFCPACQKR